MIIQLTDTDPMFAQGGPCHDDTYQHTLNPGRRRRFITGGVCYRGARHHRRAAISDGQGGFLKVKA
jgi:hypothetical protein